MRSRQGWRRSGMALLPYIAPLGVLALEWALLSPVPAVADNFQFWAAGRIVLDGRSPYERDAWLAMAAYGEIPDGVAMNTVIRNLALTREVWLYPPQTAFMFVPFGALPVGLGVPLLHAFVLVTAALGIALSARIAGLAGARLAFSLTLAAVSLPFVVSVRDGHPVGLVLLGAAMTYLGLRDRRAWPLALGVILVSVKPHIALLFVVGALAYVVVRRDARGFAVALAALAAVTIPAEVAHPFPLAALLASADERFALDVSSVGALSRDLGGGPFLTATLALAATLAAGVALWICPAGRRGPVAFGAALALSLVAVPYAHDYDQLLVLPAGSAALAVVSRSRYEIVVSGLVGLVLVGLGWILFLWWPLLGQGDRTFQGGPLGALPVLALAALALASWIGPMRRVTV